MANLLNIKYHNITQLLWKTKSFVRMLVCITILIRIKSFSTNQMNIYMLRINDLEEKYHGNKSHQFVYSIGRGYFYVKLPQS